MTNSTSTISWTSEAETVEAKSKSDLGYTNKSISSSFGEEFFICLNFRFEDLAEGTDRNGISNDRYEDGSLSLQLKFRTEAGRIKVSNSTVSHPESLLHPPSSWSYEKQQTHHWRFKGANYKIVTKKGSSYLRMSISPITSDYEATIRGVIQLLELLEGDKSLSYSEVYENQRKNHMLGAAKYSRRSLCLFDPSPWSDTYGNKLPDVDKTLLPSPGWAWIEGWKSDINIPHTDSEGWMYARGWNSKWKSKPWFGAFVRRRRVFRIRKMGLEISMAMAAATEDSEVSPTMELCSDLEDCNPKLLVDTDASRLHKIRDLSTDDIESAYLKELESNLRFISSRELLYEMSRDKCSFDALESQFSKLCTISPRYCRLQKGLSEA